MKKHQENKTSQKIILRNSRRTDYQDIKSMIGTRKDSVTGFLWSEEKFLERLKKFPEGQISIEDNGRIVAVMTNMIVNFKKWGLTHQYFDIAGSGKLENHDAGGDTLYNVGLLVAHDYEDQSFEERLYDAAKELCENLNLKSMMIGKAIRGYHNFQERMNPQTYVHMVRDNEIEDIELHIPLTNGFYIRKVVKNYMPDDVHSAGFGVLLEWINIYHQDDEKLINAPKERVRVGAVQWQVRPVASYEELMQQAEYFIDAVAGYKTDIVLFPEFFNGALMAHSDAQNPAEAVRYLASFTDRVQQDMLQLAVSYNTNIIVGSMPEYEDQELRNASYLCRRDGTVDKQYKIHVTPDEASIWGLKGGNELRLFETDFGKIGILICYDVEFPELGRLLAEKGMQILFVPFLTDTKNGYQRVRHCAQARAIENECYVVMAGAVGNLPKVENMDMQYAQAAIFTPSDFAFPHDSVAAEATPNTEMTLIADLNLDNLVELNRYGSVKNLRDRRKDLYDVKWKGSTKNKEE